MSTPTEQDVSFHQNSLITLVDRHTQGTSQKHVQTALADGMGEDTNRDMIREAVSLCVTACGRQKGERGTQRKKGALCSMTSGRTGKDPLWLHVLWTVMAVKRRHARLSVKLETTGAQLTTKSLIVGTLVHSHSLGIVGAG